MERLRDLNSGLGQFCLHLGKSISKELNHNDLTFFLPSSSVGIFGQNTNYKIVKPIHKFFSPRENYNIWHCTHQQSKYLPHNKKTKFILTIHDLNFLDKYSSKIRQKKKLDFIQQRINNASALCFISKYTEQIVREHLSVPDIPTKVIYNGNSLVTHESVQKPAFAPDSKFIFTIGIINRKKNFHVLIPLLKQLKDFKLIIPGSTRDKYTDEIKMLAMKEDIAKQLIMPGIISEEDKYWLYKNCEAFVFPSLSEGFGLPVIEAMSLGKPVFLSCSSSLPEIGGSEAYYWNNFEPNHMLNIFEQSMNEFYSDKTKPGRIMEWSKQFSWEKAAKEYITLYQLLS